MYKGVEIIEAEVCTEHIHIVRLNTATIQKYIREQEKEDQIMDEPKTKEYIDRPF